MAITHHATTDTIVLSSLSVAGGGTSTIKSNTVQVGDADIATLDFSSQFGVTESPDTEINITIESTIISGLTEVTSEDTDYMMISDTSDSGALKKVDAGEFRGGGGATVNDFDVMMIGEVYR